MTTKELREKLLKQRSMLSDDYIKEKSLMMTKDIISTKIYTESKYLYIYSPINNEIDTNYLICKALQDEKIVCLPVVLSKGDMVFCQVNKTTTYRKNQFQILEPVFEPKTIVDQPGLMIVPLVGFHDRVRLGYGKQYYNNYLFDRSNKLYTIGIGYSFQECEEFPRTSKDILLNEIRTY